MSATICGRKTWCGLPCSRAAIGYTAFGVADCGESHELPYPEPVGSGRNVACGCGSGVKWKKCCGSPKLANARNRIVRELERQLEAARESAAKEKAPR